MNVFFCQMREEGGGSYVFLVVFLSSGSLSELRRKWEAGESCNCCQSLLSTALKEAAFSQLRSERSFELCGFPCRPQEDWVSPPSNPPTPPPPPHLLVYVSLSTGAFGCSGIRGLRAYHSQITEMWVIEKISLNTPAVIWRVFKM